MKVLKEIGLGVWSAAVISIGVAIAITIVVPSMVNQAPSFGGGAGQVADACDTVTSSEVVVGASAQVTTVVASHSGNAYSRISMQGDATSTVSLSFDEGAQAVNKQGVILGQNGGDGGSATTSTQFVEFGRNTDFPYVGTVTGVTNTGTTTVAVTTCRY